MEPATVVVVAKAALAAGKDKRFRTGIATLIAALCSPFILAVMCILSIAAAGADHNKSAVQYAFEGGVIPESIPEDYREYIEQMREDFAKLDAVLFEIEETTDGALQDRYLVKSVFFSLYFGAESLKLDDADYRRFADCFVEYEQRTRTIELEDGTVQEETYMAALTITDKTAIYEKLKTDYGIEATYEQQANAMNVWHLAVFGSAAPQEGDVFSGWNSWNMPGDITCYDLPASEVGGSVVELAMGRLGHPYSQAYRGQGNYVDCSYLTMWCYKQVGITLPGTAAEQGRYMVDHNLSIAGEDLQPGDLIFWSHKPNGRYMNITHVGIYAGDGMIVDASSSKGMVVYRKLFDTDKIVLYGRPG